MKLQSRLPTHLLAALAACASLLSVWTQECRAQVGPPSGSPSSNPEAPTSLEPRGGRQSDVGDTLTLSWRQYEYSLTQAGPANYFVICLYEPEAEKCESATRRWMHAGSSIPRTALMSSPLVGTPTLLGYSYGFALPDPLAAADLYQRFEWTIGACETTLESSCTFAEPVELWLSPDNLAARNVSDSSSSKYLWLTGEVQNNGAAVAGAFDVELIAVSALHDVSRDACLTDVNREFHSHTDRDYVAITNRGELLNLGDFPLRNGRREIGNRIIVAIFLASDLELAYRASGTFSGLQPGQSAGLVSLVEDVTGLRPPLAFMSRLSVDLEDAIFEFNEDDNRRAECHVIRGEG